MRAVRWGFSRQLTGKRCLEVSGLGRKNFQNRESVDGMK